MVPADPVAHGVAKFLELVENNDAVTTLFSQFPALVVNLLDVRFRTRCGDDLVGANFLEPFETLAAHTFGENCDGRTGQ